MVAMNSDFSADLSIRGPISDAQFRAIETLMNREEPWNEQDVLNVCGYAVTLFLEVKRLRQEAKQRESDLESAMKVVSQVAATRARLCDLLAAIGGDA